MRIFSAIALPEETKVKVGELTRGRLSVPYVNTTNLHVTLNFFGELDTDATKLIKEIFPYAVEGHKCFEVVFDKMVKFHHQIHLTVKPSPEIKLLQDEMEEYFSQRGYSFPDKEYYPHVKLANLHMDKVMNKDRRLENFPNEELSALNFTAKKIVLYESKLLLHHAHHIPVVESELND
jgi:RNA 2',3'-cyclic 3'-phosphodiesterase